MGIMVETREGVKQPFRKTCVRVKKVKKCAKLETPPPNASAFRDAHAHGRALKAGLVRLETTFKGMEGSGHLEIVADDY